MNSLHPHTHTPTQLTSLHNREARASDGATGDPSDNIIEARHKNSGIIHVVPSDSLT